jgi:hypothetical protein
MARVAVFIDGFNVYHALDGNPVWGKFKWLDYAALARCYIGGRILTLPENRTGAFSGTIPYIQRVECV